MIGYPFDSEIIGKDAETGLPKLDRAQYAFQLQNYISALFSSGILPNINRNFLVSPGTGMQVLVEPGVALVGGAVAIEPNQRTLVIQASDSDLDRIDAVIIRKNNNRSVRSVDLYVLKGVPSSNPVPPVLKRDRQLDNKSSVFEIALAYIFVSRKTQAISKERITDKRTDNSVCGYSSPFENVDTTTLFDQFRAEFNILFAQMKNLISGDAAGKLQNQINQIKSSVLTDYKEVLRVKETGNLVDALAVRKIIESLPYPMTLFRNAPFTALPPQQISDIPVTFKGFVYTPVVIATAVHSWADSVNVTVMDITKNSAILRVSNRSTSPISGSINYVVVGV